MAHARLSSNAAPFLPDRQPRPIGRHGQMVSLFAGPVQHCRFITFVMPASLERLERDRRRLAMGISDDWARRGLMEEVRMIGSGPAAARCAARATSWWISTTP